MYASDSAKNFSEPKFWKSFGKFWRGNWIWNTAFLYLLINVPSWKLHSTEYRHFSILNSSKRNAQLLLERWLTLLRIILCWQFWFSYYFRKHFTLSKVTHPSLTLFSLFGSKSEFFSQFCLYRKKDCARRKLLYPQQIFEVKSRGLLWANFDFHFKNKKQCSLSKYKSKHVHFSF